MSGTRDDEKRVPDEELADVDFETEEELGDVASAAAKLKKLRDELAAVKKEKQEYLDGWQRCKADSINLRKDSEREKERARVSACQSVVESLLPAMDSFEMAMNDGSWERIDPVWRSGVESIRNQLLAGLQAVGAISFGAVGEPYDPALHDVLQEVDEEGGAGTVARVVRSGWKMHERIIRPAHVILVRIDT